MEEQDKTTEPAPPVVIRPTPFKYGIYSLPSFLMVPNNILNVTQPVGNVPNLPAVLLSHPPTTYPTFSQIGSYPNPPVFPQEHQFNPTVGQMVVTTAHEKNVQNGLLSSLLPAHVSFAPRFNPYRKVPDFEFPATVAQGKNFQTVSASSRPSNPGVSNGTPRAFKNSFHAKTSTALFSTSQHRASSGLRRMTMRRLPKDIANLLQQYDDNPNGLLQNESEVRRICNLTNCRVTPERVRVYVQRRQNNLKNGLIKTVELAKRN